MCVIGTEFNRDIFLHSRVEHKHTKKGLTVIIEPESDGLYDSIHCKNSKRSKSLEGHSSKCDPLGALVVRTGTLNDKSLKFSFSCQEQNLIFPSSSVLGWFLIPSCSAITSDNVDLNAAYCFVWVQASLSPHGNKGQFCSFIQTQVSRARTDTASYCKVLVSGGSSSSSSSRWCSVCLSTTSRLEPHQLDFLTRTTPLNFAWKVMFSYIRRKLCVFTPTTKYLLGRPLHHTHRCLVKIQEACIVL